MQLNRTDAEVQQDRDFEFRGAHAARVLASASSRSRTFLDIRSTFRCERKGKFVSAGRRNQHAWRRALRRTSPHFDFDRQHMIDHVSAAIGIV